MAWLFSDPRMLDHLPPARHPERPERLATVRRHLERTALAGACREGRGRPATDLELQRVHTPGHLARIAIADRAGGGPIEADTWMSTGSDLAARLAAGAGVEAVEAVVRGPDPVAFCAVRPPGHHARPEGPMGFCLYNSIAVAAAHAIEALGMDRVLIVDFDVHHGNGTQEIFYEEPRVGFLSIHRAPFYPGTGAADETGAGAGRGLTRNVPLPFGISRSLFLASFRDALESFAAKVRPELVLISAGFDAHAEDPIGDLGLEVEDFATITRDLVEVARVHATGRIVSLLEGGYNLPILAGCVAAHLEALGVEPAPGPR